MVAAGGLDRLAEVPGVEHAVTHDGWAKVMLAPGVEGPAVLKELVGRMEVREFTSEEPELAEIFVKAVNDAA